MSRLECKYLYTKIMGQRKLTKELKCHHGSQTGTAGEQSVLHPFMSACLSLSGHLRHLLFRCTCIGGLLFYIICASCGSVCMFDADESKKEKERKVFVIL